MNITTWEIKIWNIKTRESGIKTRDINTRKSDIGTRESDWLGLEVNLKVSESKEFKYNYFTRSEINR